MARIFEFEDIESWKMSRILVKDIYFVTKNELFRKDYGLTDQIRRAAVSVMSNIAEGFERKSNKEFVRFLYIAKGSAGEVRSQLYVAHDLEYINNNEFNKLYELSTTISQKISSFITYLESSNK